MTKGNQGESCSEAIRASLQSKEIVTFSELYKRVKQKGTWKDDFIWQDMMALIVNFPPARHHWKTTVPFLSCMVMGTYELYDPDKHPQTIE